MFFFKNPVIPAAGISFTDRGDPESDDFEFTDLIIDGQWHDLDLSSIVGTAKTLVCVRLYFNTTEASKFGKLRTKGNINSFNIVLGYTSVAGQSFPYDGWVVTDTTGKVEYNFTADLIGTIGITVAHYFTL